MKWNHRTRCRTRLAALVAAALFLPGGAVMADPAPQPVPQTVPELSSVSGSYLAGRFAQHVDDWTNAASYMQRVLTHTPDDPAMARRTFLLLLGEGRIDEALALTDRMPAGKEEAQKSESQIAQVLLVTRSVVADRPDEAMEQLRGMAGDGLAQYVRPLLEAWLVAARGDVAAAMAALAPLARAPGFKPLHDLHAALIADFTNDTEAAGRWYATTLESGAPLRVVEAAGSFYERTGRRDEARRLYETFQAKNNDTPMIEPALRRLAQGGVAAPAIAGIRAGIGGALFDVASALHQDGAEEVALMYGRLALHAQPGLGMARLMVGDILASREQDAAALTEYRALESDPSFGWTARMRVAETLHRLDRLDEAIAQLDAMATERPERTDALVRLGDLLRTAKRFDEAVAVYSRAIDRLDKQEPRHWALFYSRALSYDRIGRWPETESDLKRAIELGPDQPYVLNYLGYSWVDRGQNLEKARDLIQRAVALRPDDGYITDSLGWVLYLMGDLTSALSQMERAVELKPLDPTINDHLGDVYWAVGRRAEARFQWQRALQNADVKEDEKLIPVLRQKLEHGLRQKQAQK